MRSIPLALTGIAFLAAGCGDAPDPAPAAPPWRAVLDPALEAGAAAGLPELAEARILECAELMEAAAVPGRLGTAAHRNLEEWPVLERAAALLAILEDRDSAPVLRRDACSWLENFGAPAAVPRLVLRLKYEKDWVANVGLARALLAQGSGAGLEALANILRAEDSTVEDARFLAGQALALLPEGTGWTRASAGDFPADFAHLLRVQGIWSAERRLHGGDGVEQDVLADPGLRTEVWRMAARLRSQALRPVDDARFVLARMRAGVIGPLTELAYDRDVYVREAALQTLAWIGYACGRWARRTAFDWVGWFARALDVPVSRMRALEALGGSGLPEVAAPALHWLAAGGPDAATAAADALLRSATPDAFVLDAVAARLAAGGLAPEAAYSLLWMQRLPAAGEPLPAPPAAPPGLATDERARRDRWASERALRPQ
ncbi:MAG TPA: hypothetical protein VGC54_02305 [Planctomycetota bacterium]